MSKKRDRGSKEEGVSSDSLDVSPADLLGWVGATNPADYPAWSTTLSDHEAYNSDDMANKEEATEQSELAFIADLLAEGVQEENATRPIPPQPAIREPEEVAGSGTSSSSGPGSPEQSANLQDFSQFADVPPAPLAPSVPTPRVDPTEDDMASLGRSMPQTYTLGTSKIDQALHAQLLRRSRSSGHAAVTSWVRNPGSSDLVRMHIVFRDRCAVPAKSIPPTPAPARWRLSRRPRRRPDRPCPASRACTASPPHPPDPPRSPRPPRPPHPPHPPHSPRLLLL